MGLVERGNLDLDGPMSKYGIELQSRGTITVRHLFSHTSEGTPGARYSLLDRVIQSVTGKSFAANLEDLIIDPLGLNNTAAEPQDLAVPLAKPYTFSRKRGFIQGR